MSIDSLGKASDEIEMNKAKIEKNFSDLKNDFRKLGSQMKNQRNEVLNDTCKSLLENPFVTIAEFFFVGFYVGKMAKMLNNRSGEVPHV